MKRAYQPHASGPRDLAPDLLELRSLPLVDDVFGSSDTSAAAQEQIMTIDEEEQASIAPATAASVAASFRAQAYGLMDDAPIAAAHLVLAAASLAPECDEEREVADHFSFLVADFAVGLAKIHHRARVRHRREAEGHADEAR